MVNSTRVTLATVSAGMPPERACSLRRSHVLSYDNMTRVADATKWTYNGGPNLNTTYTGATGFISLLGAYTSRWDKARYEWSYSLTNALAVQSALKPLLIGANINGYISNVPAITAFGSRTLYGVRHDYLGIGNALVDTTDPADRARLLGDDLAAATYPDNMRGISDWARAGTFGAMLHDEGSCMWGAHSSGGSFRSTTWAGFTAHGSGLEYGAYLRTIYASDAAYDTARPTGLVAAYTAARRFLLEKVYEWHGVAAERAHSLGMDYSLNVAGPLPTYNGQMCFGVIYHADYVMCELAWQTAWRDVDSSRFATDRATAETLSDATTIRRMFAAQALHAACVRGAGRKFTFAVYPLLAWMPAKSGGASSPPSTAAYTVPYKVAAAQKVSWCWLQAWGGPSIIPAGIYDEATDQSVFGYTGYTGNNKPLYYMDPATAKPWFNWVASRADILDDFDLAATVAIVQPLTANRWAGAADGSQNINWRWMESYIRPLVEANVPFVILPVDSALGYDQSAYDLTKYLTVITAANDTLTLPGSLSTYAPVTVAGSSDSTRPVFCVPRIDSTRKKLALHVVNSHSCDYAASSGAGAAGTTQTAITLTLKPWAMLTRRISSARWYSHESSPQGTPVRVDLNAQGPVVYVPPFLEGGVVLLEFA